MMAASASSAAVPAAVPAAVMAAASAAAMMAVVAAAEFPEGVHGARPAATIPDAPPPHRAAPGEYREAA